MNNLFDDENPLFQKTFYSVRWPLYQQLLSGQWHRTGHYTPDALKYNPNCDSAVFFGTDCEGYPIGKPDNLDGNVIVFGGSGAGKTTGIAIPTLHTWKGSIFAIDTKGCATRS